MLSKFCLIHGSMIGAPSMFKSTRTNQEELRHGSFRIFSDEIEQGEIDLYRWNDIYHRNLRYNPISPLLAYIKDRQRVNSLMVQNNLYTHLTNTQPSILIAHSKGCQLIIETFSNLGLPESVKTIVFMQSDADDNNALPQLADNIKIVNLYCPDDATLWFSVLLNNGKIRDGLRPSNHPNITNIKHYSRGDHNSTLKDKSIKEFLLSL
jgi:hypothetical protein